MKTKSEVTIGIVPEGELFDPNNFVVPSLYLCKFKNLQ